VLTKADLTSADLTEIRASALGAADPLGVAAELAEAVDAGRLADAQDAGYALALAAEIAESRGKLDAALRYAGRAVDAYGERDDSQAAAARALRARILFRSGHEDDALAALEPLRPLLTRHADAAAYISAALAAGGRNRVAEEWLTAAVREALAAPGQNAEPASAEDAGLLFFLLQQRHRTRHALGLPHDTHETWPTGWRPGWPAPPRKHRPPTCCSSRRASSTGCWRNGRRWPNRTVRTSTSTAPT